MYRSIKSSSKETIKWGLNYSSGFLCMLAILGMLMTVPFTCKDRHIVIATLFIMTALSFLIF